LAIDLQFSPLSFAEAPKGVAGKKIRSSNRRFSATPEEQRLPEGSNGTGVRSSVAKTTRRGSFLHPKGYKDKQKMNNIIKY
jgi:hypothetical protein